MDNIGKLISQQSEQKKEAVPEWGQPIPFDNRTLPVFDPSVFPDWLSKYIEAVAETTQTPVDASCFAAISILSTISQTKAILQINSDWKESLNTYSILALPPGSRKSGVFKAFQEPITLFERDESERLKFEISTQAAGKKAKEARLRKLEKDYASDNKEETLKSIELLQYEIESTEIMQPPRLSTNDVTVEKLGLLMSGNKEAMSILSAEGAGALNSIAGRYDGNSVDASMNLYLEAYSGDSVTIDRMGRESIYLDNPKLTIGLFVQPESMRNLPKNFQDRGLLQRFFYSFPQSWVGYRDIETETIPEELRTQYISNLKQLLEFDPSNAIVLTLSESAQRLEIENRTEIEVMLRDDGKLGGIMTEWGSKLGGGINRIAGLLHIAKHIDHISTATTVVSEETYLAAKSLRDYFIAHTKEAYGVMKSTDGEKNCMYLLERISDKFEGIESFSYRELQQSVRRKLELVELKKGLNQLEEMNYLKVLDEKKKIIKINPSFLNTEKRVLNVLNTPKSHKRKGFEKSSGENSSVLNVLDTDTTSTESKEDENNMSTVRTSEYARELTTNIDGSKGEDVMSTVSTLSQGITINEDGSGLL
ncbi:DUF3987 domain-containing protein [Sporosarcina sp. ANT_H38]|uniref:YfjI family protein n=1 Tax=Sporosarcina sp. ANT_H38 TaxID=2597358 RepID=UPI0011F33FBB|nr:YfjI family protein [Sporosarcina sp. ANT_H38]KAA0941638.1 DUF3987 domain-containing protein [Sporosarcina sp. ANT_H38]